MWDAGSFTGRTNWCWRLRWSTKSLRARGVEPLEADNDRLTRLFSEQEVGLKSSKVLTTRWVSTYM